jgi:hypothetical protein
MSSRTNGQYIEEQRVKREREKMTIVRTTAAALISGLLISGASMPAWSAPANQELTVAQATVPQTSIESAISVLGSPESARPSSRPDAERNCKPGHMYSAHDIVGDPQACIWEA